MKNKNFGIWLWIVFATLILIIFYLLLKWARVESANIEKVHNVAENQTWDVQEIKKANCEDAPTDPKNKLEIAKACEQDFSTAMLDYCNQFIAKADSYKKEVWTEWNELKNLAWWVQQDKTAWEYIPSWYVEICQKITENLEKK